MNVTQRMTQVGNDNLNHYHKAISSLSPRVSPACTAAPNAQPNAWVVSRSVSRTISEVLWSLSFSTHYTVTPPPAGQSDEDVNLWKV